MLNIAVVGNGRTGGEVVRLVEASSEVQLSIVFNEDTPLSVEGLQNSDVAIVFVPPTAMDEVIPVLLDAQVNVICGTTGYVWSQQLLERLSHSPARWVVSHNFSLGMNLIRRCLALFGQSHLLYGEPRFAIEEVHHTGKLDAPSGTAISWQQWLDIEAPITSIREGDVKGDHCLTMETEFETIELRHHAKDRALFAQGAIWAAQRLVEAHQHLAAELTPFSQLVDQHLAQQHGLQQYQGETHGQA